ncbi:MAG: ribokinase [Thalassospira sp.]|nr:ribokinase [Thalassospira sp.]|tara:strand:- start:4263 stop:5177 length:915 start_codon:yes stop_codon:yes gene_type:complete
MMSVDVICIGEAMGEISFSPTGDSSVKVGGDTFNTAVYLGRLGIKSGFASAVGTDPFGDMIRAVLRDNQVSDAFLISTDLANTGLYSITNRADGERFFHYWRNQSAARQTLSLAPPVYLQALEGAPWLYLSGISLHVLEEDMALLMQTLEACKAKGGKIAFDGNFRPKLWEEKHDQAREIYARITALSDLVLPTFEDEALLWGDATAQATIDRIAKLGPSMIVVKQGADGCLLYDHGDVAHIAIPNPVTAVDTTAAGDSFNAGFLAALIKGEDGTAATLSGHELAAKVITHRGAIIPADAMDVS